MYRGHGENGTISPWWANAINSVLHVPLQEQLLRESIDDSGNIIPLSSEQMLTE